MSHFSSASRRASAPLPPASGSPRARYPRIAAKTAAPVFPRSWASSSHRESPPRATSHQASYLAQSPAELQSPRDSHFQLRQASFRATTETAPARSARAPHARPVARFPDAPPRSGPVASRSSQKISARHSLISSALPIPEPPPGPSPLPPA